MASQEYDMADLEQLLRVNDQNFNDDEEDSELESETDIADRYLNDSLINTTEGSSQHEELAEHGQNIQERLRKGECFLIIFRSSEVNISLLEI